MIRLFPCTVCKAKAVEYFETPALQPISLTVEDLRTAFVDDPSVYAATSHPCRKHESVKDQPAALCVANAEPTLLVPLLRSGCYWLACRRTDELTFYSTYTSQFDSWSSLTVIIQGKSSEYQSNVMMRFTSRELVRRVCQCSPSGLSIMLTEDMFEERQEALMVSQLGYVIYIGCNEYWNQLREPCGMRAYLRCWRRWLQD